MNWSIRRVHRTDQGKSPLKEGATISVVGPSTNLDASSITKEAGPPEIGELFADSPRGLIQLEVLGRPGKAGKIQHLNGDAWQDRASNTLNPFGDTWATEKIEGSGTKIFRVSVPD